MAYLLPPLKQKFTDSNNLPLVGGKVYTYIAGTTTPRVTYTDSTAVGQNTNPIILDANGECDIWIGSGAIFKIVVTDAADVLIYTIDNVSIPAGGGGGGGSLPSGGAAGTVLSKITSTDQDADWATFAKSGYSARYGQTVSLANIEAFMDFVLNIQYTAPTISLAAAGSGTVREKGVSVASTLLTATVTKTSDPIARLDFLQGASAIATYFTNPPVPNGGVETYNYATAFTNTISFSATTTDTGITGGPSTTTSNTVTFTFVYPYFYGAGAAALSAAAIAALTKSVIVSTATVNVTMAAASTNVLYFAYPNSYGLLTSILDVNNFETITDWTSSTKTFTALDGSSQTYRVYEFNNPLVAGSYYYSFRR